MTDVPLSFPPPTAAPYPVPAPFVVAPRPPSKWLGRWGGWLVFLGLTFFWFCNVLFDQLVLHHVGLSPNSLVLGGFGMTAALVYTMAYRLRPQDGISVVRLGLAFLLGGLFSTELAILVEAPLVLALGSNPHGALIAHSLAGVIEEACKLAAVVIAARGLGQRDARNGLFIGGAVGLGFAAFEDMRYASEALADGVAGRSPLLSVLGVTFGRDVIGPLEHPVMTALLAAALFAASRNGRFRITGTVILVYLGVAAAHGLIDTAPDLIALGLRNSLLTAGLGGLAGILVAVGLGVVWLVYSKRLKRQMLEREAAAPVEQLDAPPPTPFASPQG
jgi:RsiW-degrading membrane proteinase PrsW (M82 family)